RAGSLVPWVRRRRWEGAVLLLYVALALLLFHELVFAGRVLFARDLEAGAYPAAESFVRGVAGGSWPLWGPHVRCGQPRLANPESEVLYPLTWLTLFVTPWTRYTVLVLTHLPFTALGACLLASAFGASRAGSVLAGAAWMASGPLLSLV